MRGEGLLLLVAALMVYAMPNLVRTGRLRRNWLYGIRLRSTLASDEAWRVGHAAAAGLCFAAALPAAVVGLILVVHETDRETAGDLVMVAAGLLVFFALWGCVRADRAAKSLSR